MTGPPDPNHDLPEPQPRIIPVWGKSHGHSFCPTLPSLEEAYVTRVVLPFGWELAIDPDKGAVVRHAVREDLPSLLPSAVLGAAKLGAYGFRLADDAKGA